MRGFWKFLALLLLVTAAGCTESFPAILRAQLAGDSEFVDRMMLVVDEESAKDYIDNYKKALDDKDADVKKRDTFWFLNLDKKEKKENEAFKERIEMCLNPTMKVKQPNQEFKKEDEEYNQKVDAFVKSARFPYPDPELFEGLTHPKFYYFFAKEMISNRVALKRQYERITKVLTEAAAAKQADPAKDFPNLKLVMGECEKVLNIKKPG